MDICYNSREFYEKREESKMRVERRSIGVCILLSIITFGIYMFYWMYKVNDDVAVVSGEPPITTGGMLILLTIVTCGIYGIYWAYTTGEKLDRVRASHGEPTGSLGVLYLVLEFFIAPVAIALMQSELNKYAQG